MKKLKIKRSIPIILAGIGTVGVIATTVMTAKATIKATELIEKAEAEKDEKIDNYRNNKNYRPSMYSNDCCRRSYNWMRYRFSNPFEKTAGSFDWSI